MTVRLQPWGTIIGRIVDDDGQPRGGLALNNIGGIYPEPPADQGILPESTGAGHPDRPRRPVPHRGPGPRPQVRGERRRGDRCSSVTVFRDVIVAPGEVKDLGDLKVIPPKPNGQE